jgi:hypothetical protein
MANTTDNSNLTNSSSPYYLLSIQQNMTRSMLIFLVFGNIGNLCNCFVFLQKPLRSNSCSFYLLVSSIANIITLTFSILTGLYSTEQTNPSTYSLIYCKLRLYIYQTFLMISRYVIVFACIDRACLTSRQVIIRNFSQIHKARILSILIIIFWFIAAIHIPIMSTIQYGYCIMPGIYTLIFSIYDLIFAGLIPPILMSAFSLITLLNLHSVHVRIHASSTQANRVMHQRDFHLTRMLIAQVVIYVLTTTPYPVYALYAAVTKSMKKSLDQQMVESFVYFITGTFLLFINPSLPFYIYMTTSKAFRKEFTVASTQLCHKVVLKQLNNSMTTHNDRIFLARTLAQRRGGFQTSPAPTTRSIADK